jgi:predicted dehydrogenase
VIRIGLIGSGYWGPNLARNISESERAELVAVADLDRDRLGVIQRRYPSIRVTTNAAEIAEADDIDAVVLATPVGTHHALGIQALERGKHLLIEKPMTRTVAEAQELVSLAERQKRVLMVDHTFVYTGVSFKGTSTSSSIWHPMIYRSPTTCWVGKPGL